MPVYTYLDKNDRHVTVDSKVKFRTSVSKGDHWMMRQWIEAEGVVTRLHGATVYVRGPKYTESFRVIGTGEYVHDRPNDEYMVNFAFNHERKAIITEDRKREGNHPLGDYQRVYVEVID